MHILFLFLLLFAADTPKAKTPLKITVLYFSGIDENLRKELLKDISATYYCTVTEIKGIAALPAALIISHETATGRQLCLNTSIR